MSEYIFCHYCLFENFERVVIPQVQRLVESPLYGEADGIFCTVLNHRGERPEWLPEKFQIVYAAESAEAHEFPTLTRLHQFAKENPGHNLLYLHGKGVSQMARTDVRDSTKNHIRLWREYMEYFLIDQYKECIAHLYNYDLVGVEWRDFPERHFSGNMWWATTDYLAGLPLLTELDLEQRWLAEFWVAFNSRAKIKGLYNFGLDLYHQPADPARYQKYRRRCWTETEKGWRIF